MASHSINTASAGWRRRRTDFFTEWGADDDETARLPSYDPERGVYEVLGMVDVNRRPYYSWRAHVIGAMALGPEGTVYVGQSERKSKLYLCCPEPRR